MRTIISIILSVVLLPLLLCGCSSDEPEFELQATAGVSSRMYPDDGSAIDITRRMTWREYDQKLSGTGWFFRDAYVLNPDSTLGEYIEDVPHAFGHYAVVFLDGCIMYYYGEPTTRLKGQQRFPLTRKNPTYVDDLKSSKLSILELNSNGVLEMLKTELTKTDLKWPEILDKEKYTQRTYFQLEQMTIEDIKYVHDHWTINQYHSPSFSDERDGMGVLQLFDN